MLLLLSSFGFLNGIMRFSTLFGTVLAEGLIHDGSIDGWVKLSICCAGSHGITERTWPSGISGDISRSSSRRCRCWLDYWHGYGLLGGCSALDLELGQSGIEVLCNFEEARILGLDSCHNVIDTAFFGIVPGFFLSHSILGLQLVPWCAQYGGDQTFHAGSHGSHGGKCTLGILARLAGFVV